MIDSETEIYSVPGLAVETVINDKVYLARGYPEDQCYPAKYDSLMLIIGDGDSIYVKGFLAIDGWRIDQRKKLSKYFKSKGYKFYAYERSNGKSFRMKTCVL